MTESIHSQLKYNTGKWGIPVTMRNGGISCAAYSCLSSLIYTSTKLHYTLSLW